MILIDYLAVYAGIYHGDRREQAARTGARSGHQWSHMTSTQGGDCVELHAFAAKLGLKREWHQKDHYDLVPKRRAAAVKLGAIETNARVVSQVIGNNRRGAPPMSWPLECACGHDEFHHGLGRGDGHVPPRGECCDCACLAFRLKMPARFP